MKKIFALGDPHLSLSTEKPMDIFGAQWSNHPFPLAENWKKIVEPTDWVLMPGDISWAMNLEEAAADLAFLDELPGRKVLIRGNHDYWWSTLTKVRAALPPSLQALQNDSLVIDDSLIVCGTRGWNIPGSRDFKEDDSRIYEREVNRLKLSLEHAAKAKSANPDAEVWVMMHYPPILESAAGSDFTRLLEEFGATKCIYGHIHGPGIPSAFTGTIRGIEYILSSCDAVEFTPLLLRELN